MTQELPPAPATGERPEPGDGVVPSDGRGAVPLVGLGGSAGSIEALQEFFSAMPARSGLAFAVAIHLSPEHESVLDEVLQQCTRMPVVKVESRLDVEPDTVYVVPPGQFLQLEDGQLRLQPIPPGRPGNLVVDVLFRTLAESHGARAAAVVLSGLGSDGALGIKRIKECGGLTVAQDPQQALHPDMPQAAVDTGVVDWVLPVRDMPARLLTYFRLEQAVELPPEPAQEPLPPEDPLEQQLAEVLGLLRTRTGRDFSKYKRATVLRRIGRRMQVNGVDHLAAYVDCLRTRPGECNALVQDLLISVTNFFREPDAFGALQAQIPSLFEGKGPNDTVRVWVVACATGEEAYSVAMLLAEHARTLESPPALQVFATDLDDQAIQSAREAVYPAAIEADVSEARLRRFFRREGSRYRVRRELRELVLFAVHDVLADAPFSRLDLVSCRNLLIYLTRDAQERVLQVLHFALSRKGKLFLGMSETADEAGALFSVLDKKHRIYVQRPTARRTVALPSASAMLTRAVPTQPPARSGPAGTTLPSPWHSGAAAPLRSQLGELHLELLERLAPPSLLVDGDQEIVHVSPSAGRFLQLAGGEPSRNLLKSIQPDLRIDVRATLYAAAQNGKEAILPPVPWSVVGGTVMAGLRVIPVTDSGETLFLLLFEVQPAAGETAQAKQQRLEADPLARHLDAEIERLKTHLRDTVQQYEASTEELKASNEELQAMDEEMRAATEELETGREELQSINEELATVNTELRMKVEQLSAANSDIQNLMDATRIATVFLDRELRITRFTPAARGLFNLIPGDLGRPLTDMATQLDYPDLGADAHRVLDQLVPIEREVGHAAASWYLARLIPYRTVEDRIAGVVFTFIDITERKRAEDTRLWLSTVVSSTSDAIISFALDQAILSWNPGAQRLFGYTPDEAIGHPVSLLLTDDGAREQAHIVAEIAAGRGVDNLETVRRRKDGSRVHVALTASPIRDARGRVVAGTAMVRDISTARAAAEALRQSEERLRLIVESAVEYAIFSTDLERRVTSWNSGAERLLGFAATEVLGQSADIIFTPEDRERGAPQAEAGTARSEGRASDERMHLRKDGSRFRGTGTMMLMRNQAGEAVGFVKILRDLTRPEPDPGR